jgi:hypothetical protein
MHRSHSIECRAAGRVIHAIPVDMGRTFLGGDEGAQLVFGNARVLLEIRTVFVMEKDRLLIVQQHLSYKTAICRRDETPRCRNQVVIYLDH